MSSTKSSGGSFYQDLQNLAVPFGLILAAHGVGYVSKKADKSKTAKKGGAAASPKPKAAKKPEGAKTVKASKKPEGAKTVKASKKTVTK